MIVAVNQTAGTSYSRYLLIKSIDDENLHRARDIFSFYKKQEVILSDSFDNDTWELSDERMRVRLNFRFSEVLFHENARQWIACTADCYKQAIKAYVMFRMGTLSIHTLREITNALRRMGEADFSQVVAIRSNACHAMELLQLIPGYSKERDAVIEALEENATSAKMKTRNPRELTDFGTYFRFHDELNNFWVSASENEKLFYFPVFLWWNLTAILPLRPTEFLMMPRDCLIRQESGDFVVIRRTKLKGGTSKLTYRIDGDFIKKSYPINSSLADEIEWYQVKTEGMNQSPIGALFCREACSNYKRWDKGTSIENAYGYLNLNNTLKILAQEVLTERIDIAEIHLGDTRHIAMMNLIISGGSPVVCMELAGHEDIDISSNYYANMANLVECATYEMYRKNRKGALASFQGKQDYSLTDPGTLVRIKDGWCGSIKRKVMEVDDCIMAVNSLGELGDCKNCKHFRPDVQGVQLEFYDPLKGKAQVNADSWFLMHMIEAVRQGIGLKEDIKSAMLRLQHSCNHYRNCLLTNYEKDEV